MKIENKKWLLRTALACALGLGAASIAKADARLDGMGANVQEVDDVDAIWLYPNELLQYKNTVDFRLNAGGFGTNFSPAVAGVGENEWGGVIHDLGDDFGTIATYVNRPSFIFNDSLVSVLGTAIIPLFATDASIVGGATNNYAPSDNVDVFWAKNGFGLHLTYGDNEDNTNGGGAATPPVSSQVWGLSAGFDLGSFMSFSKTQFHIDYAEDFLTLNRRGAATGPLTDNGVYTFKLGWLGETTLNPNDNARVFADLEYDNDSLPTGWTTNTNAHAQQAANDFEFLLGSSIKHNISDRGFVNTGLEFEYDGLNTAANTPADSWTLEWNASVESSLSSWLTARAGLDKALVNRTYAQGQLAPVGTDDSLVNALNNQLAFSAGLSAAAENWTLDAQISVADLTNNLSAPAIGSGIFYANGTLGSNLIQAIQADLRYKF